MINKIFDWFLKYSDVLWLIITTIAIMGTLMLSGVHILTEPWYE